jgi:hypothetical protein
VRSVDLQRIKADEIDGYVLGIKHIKAQAVDRAEEDIARLMLHFQCMLRSVQLALRVWVELKDGDNVRAWSNLVDAQEYCEVALVARRPYECQDVGGCVGPNAGVPVSDVQTV